MSNTISKLGVARLWVNDTEITTYIDPAQAVVGAPAVGITSATGELVKSSVERHGDIITTTILLDITGLASVATGNDIIGAPASGAVSYYAQLPTDIGTVFGGEITCLEIPATGDVDIDFHSADEATGAQNADVTALTNTVLLTKGGNWAAGDRDDMTGIAVAGEYLYISAGGGATAGTYTTGKFRIQFYSYV